MNKHLFFALLSVMFFLSLSNFHVSAKNIEIEYEYIQEGNYDIQTYSYEYGTRRRMDTGDFDAYLKITESASGLIIKTIIYDDGEWEFFVYFAEMDMGKIALVCKQYSETDNFELPEYVKTVVQIYDLSGNHIMEKAYYDKYIGYNNHGEILILHKFDGSETYINYMLRSISKPNPGGEYLNDFSYQFQGEAYINDTKQNSIELEYPGNYMITIIDGNYEFSFTVVLNALIEGVKENKVYTCPVQISTAGVLLLNGEAYTPGTLVEQPGNYELWILGEGDYLRTLQFVIYPVIENVSDGMETVNAIRIFSNGVKMDLNGQNYTGDLIYLAGTYDLDVYGINNFKCTLSFWILPEVSGIENEGEYQNFAELWTNAEATLNGERITNYTIIDTPGRYTLTLFFDGEEFETYAFSVFSQSISARRTYDYSIVSYVLTALAIGGLIIIFKKK